MGLLSWLFGKTSPEVIRMRASKIAKQATALKKKGRLADAIGACDEAIGVYATARWRKADAFPNLLPIYFKKARYMVEAGESAAALAHLQTVLKATHNRGNVSAAEVMPMLRAQVRSEMRLLFQKTANWRQAAVQAILAEVEANRGLAMQMRSKEIANPITNATKLDHYLKKARAQKRKRELRRVMKEAFETAGRKYAAVDAHALKRGLDAALGLDDGESAGHRRQ